MSHDFLLAVLTYLIATASPGPSNLALMTVAMNHGRRVALAMACGIISGSTWWGAMAVLGFAGVLQTYAEVLVLLKVIGAAYLFWLALISLRRVFVTASTSTSLPESRATFAAHYQRGLKLHLSNPKAIFTWLAIASCQRRGRRPGATMCYFFLFASPLGQASFLLMRWFFLPNRYSVAICDGNALCT